MAPRKRHTTRDSGTAKALNPKPARVAKKTAAAAPLRRSARVADQPPKDGLLNLRKTPEHLVAIAKRNSVASPLLRLPPELRNKIWRFAIGGEYIEMPVTQRLLNEPKRKDRTAEKLAVFRIPSVSRQVYAETATMPYSANTFCLSANINMMLKNWPVFLIPAYRNAIVSIALRYIDFIMLRDLQDSHGKEGKLLPTHLPKLQTIEIDAVDAMDLAWGLEYLEHGMLEVPQDECEALVIARLKENYGEHLQIVVLDLFWLKG
ncbi:hypothetical protein DE146DRAFT_362550 [Phaeosphaeria sp. MPI-PUGE-AT-0046c]|nr:hypothetical protein DE146DRAFT_362550 [Phaeosphaeria sp. MPI-PUGE-AT-0046c]